MARFWSSTKIDNLLYNEELNAMRMVQFPNTSPPIEYFMSRDITGVTLTTLVPIDTNIFTLSDVTGISIGDYLEISYVDYDNELIRFFQSEIYQITGNNIYVTMLSSVYVE